MYISTLVLNLKRVLCRNTNVCVSIMPQLMVGNESFNASQVRFYAARKGKRAKMHAAKMEKKLTEANKPAVRGTPKYLPKKTKQHAKECRRFTDENWLDFSTTDDIWQTKFCRGKPYPVTEAITILKEMHHPSMLNNPQAFLYTTIELDLRMKKKNNFLDEFTGTVLFPHGFETGSTNRIIALSENSDDQFSASEAGAIHVGGVSLIKRIEKGEIKLDEFDYVVCHLDLLKDINKLRGLLKKRFPSVRNGLITACLDKTVAEFVKCTEYTANASTIEPDFGWIDVHFGRLNMTHRELEDNLQILLSTVEEKHKPTGVENQLFITRTKLWCSKSAETFKIPHWDYLPGYPLNGVFQPEDLEEAEDVGA